MSMLEIHVLILLLHTGYWKISQVCCAVLVRVTIQVTDEWYFQYAVYIIFIVSLQACAVMPGVCAITSVQ